MVLKLPTAKTKATDRTLLGKFLQTRKSNIGFIAENYTKNTLSYTMSLINNRHATIRPALTHAHVHTQNHALRKQHSNSTKFSIFPIFDHKSSQDTTSGNPPFRLFCAGALLRQSKRKPNHQPAPTAWKRTQALAVLRVCFAQAPQRTAKDHPLRLQSSTKHHHHADRLT